MKEASTDLNISAPPWKYNPSSWSNRAPICALAGIAAAIAGYLALFQWGLIDSVWDPFFGKQSEQVIDSDVSHQMYRYIGVPDAALGVLAYLGDAVFGLAGSTRRWQYRPWLVILFGIDVIPLGIVSAVLVLLQGFLINAWCTLCLVTAVISLVLVVLTYDEVWSSLKYLHYVRKERPALFWSVLWGKRRSVELEEEYCRIKGVV